MYSNNFSKFDREISLKTKEIIFSDFITYIQYANTFNGDKWLNVALSCQTSLHYIFR